MPSSSLANSPLASKWKVPQFITTTKRNLYVTKEGGRVYSSELSTLSKTKINDIMCAGRNEALSGEIRCCKANHGISWCVSINISSSALSFFLFWGLPAMTYVIFTSAIYPTLIKVYISQAKLSTRPCPLGVFTS